MTTRTRFSKFWEIKDQSNQQKKEVTMSSTKNKKKSKSACTGKKMTPYFSLGL